jgi:hypothetical protein
MKDFLFCCLSLALCALPIRGEQNLVTNGSFDRDTSGWGGAAIRDFYWDPRDADGSPFSGSAAVTADGSDGYLYAGCFQTWPSFGEKYVFEADVRFPNGPQFVSIGAVNLIFQWSSPTAPAVCAPPIAATSTSPTQSDTDGAWHHLRTLSPPAPFPGYSTIFPLIHVHERLGFPPTLLLLDNVRVVPVFFADDFESGDLRYWDYSQE